jgi:hypothetical protein
VVQSTVSVFPTEESALAVENPNTTSSTTNSIESIEDAGVVDEAVILQSTAKDITPDAFTSAVSENSISTAISTSRTTSESIRILADPVKSDGETLQSISEGIATIDVSVVSSATEVINSDDEFTSVTDDPLEVSIPANTIDNEVTRVTYSIGRRSTEAKTKAVTSDNKNRSDIID